MQLRGGQHRKCGGHTFREHPHWRNGMATPFVWGGGPPDQTDRRVAARSRRSPTRSASLNSVPKPRTRNASHMHRAHGPSRGNTALRQETLSAACAANRCPPGTQQDGVLGSVRPKVVATLAPREKQQRVLCRTAAVNLGARRLGGRASWRMGMRRSYNIPRTQDNMLYSRCGGRNIAWPQEKMLYSRC